MENNVELNPFEQTIYNHLSDLASKDSLFGVSFNKDNKSIKECINYIYESVRKSGRIGFNDDEIFNMAIHYYDEDDIKDIKSQSCKVVVNHSVEEPIKEVKNNIPEPKEKPKKHVRTATEPFEQLSMF